MKHSTAKTRKIISPTGILPILIRFLYQPPSAELWGQLTVWVLVNTEARPLAMFMLAIDTINGGMDQYATRYPLNTPNRTPIKLLKPGSAP